MSKIKKLTKAVLGKKINVGSSIWITDPECTGLMVRISNSQRRGRLVTWYYRYRDRVTGKRKPVRLGEYPALSIDEAREMTLLKLRRLRDQGKDVGQELAREAKEARTGSAESIAELAPKYLAFCVTKGKAKGTIEGYRRYLRPLVAWYGDSAPSTLTRGDAQDLFYRVQKDGVPPVDIDGAKLQRGKSSGGHRAAGQMLSSSRAFFTWCLDREYVDRNVFAGQKALSEEGRAGISNRALTDKEITGLLRSTVLSLRDMTIIKLLLATGLRPNEVCAAEWREFDLKKGIWDLPIGRLKYKQAGHTVYLSKFALDALRVWRAEQHGRFKYLFPTDGMKHPHVKPDNLHERLGRVGIDGLTPKVLRATVRTLLQRLKVTLEVRQRMSHHQQGTRVERSYDHHDYGREMKQGWATLGRHLKKLS